MNVARIESDVLPFINDLFFKAGIEETSDYINTKLTEYILDNNINNNWFILDYPSPDIIRSIYQSNDPNNKKIILINIKFIINLKK